VTDVARRILILRRENIGDLVCTTPLIRALRVHLPQAHIALLANSYNVAVVANNADLNANYAYTKGKHAGSRWAALRSHLARARMLLDLRRQRFDDVVLADPSYIERNIRLARFITAGRPGSRVIGFSDVDGRQDGLDLAFDCPPGEAVHIVDQVFRLARAWDIAPPAPACHIAAPTGEVRPAGRQGKIEVVGLHISARRPAQRWPADRFAAVARGIHQANGVRCKLFWSPGDDGNALHPGDDRKAGQVLALARDIPLEPMPTESLEALIAGLAGCDAVICADGGAMHVAAGLGLPIVCLFGDSDAVRWHPWGVRYRLLQKPSGQVMDIQPEEVIQAFDALQNEARPCAEKRD
jgi:ADP-heptose:LPS heptosyltransferase